MIAIEGKTEYKNEHTTQYKNNYGLVLNQRSFRVCNV